MTETGIIIFDTDNEAQEISNKNDIELFYENLKNNQKFSPQQINIFYEMTVNEKKEEFIDSNINNIILEDIIEKYKDYLILMLYDLPNINIKLQTIEDDEHINSTKQKVSIKLKNAARCEHNGNLFVMPKGTDINIVGVIIKVPPLKQPPEGLLRNGAYTIIDLLNHFYITSARPIYKNTAENLSAMNKFDQDSRYYIFKFKNIDDELQNIRSSIHHINSYFLGSNTLFYNVIHGLLGPVLLRRSNASAKKIKTPEITALGKVLNRDFVYENIFNSSIDLLNAGYFDIYNKSQINNSILENINKKLNNIVNSENIRNEQTFQKFTRMMQLFQKKTIAYKKFHKYDLNKLTKAEEAAVNKDYEKIITYKSKLNDDELKMVRDMFNSIGAENYDEIKKYVSDINEISKLGKNGFFLNRKGYNLLCGHVMDKAQMLMKKYKNIIDKSISIRNEMIQKYAEKTDSGYFCKLCGELLSEVTKDEGVSNDAMREYSIKESEYDSLYSMIYRETIYIITTFIHIRDASALNLANMIRSIVELIRPEITLIQNSILNVKTAQKDNINLTVLLYIYIYVFAAICQLIYTNNEAINFKDNFIKGGAADIASPFIVYKNKISSGKVNTQPLGKNTPKIEKKIKDTKKNKNDLQRIINNGLAIIKRVKRADILRSDFMTEDSIKGLFLKAYRMVINSKYVSINYSSLNYFIQNEIIGYMIYGYNQLYKNKLPIFYNHKLPEWLGNKDNALFNNIHLILGRNYDVINRDLTRNVSIYNTLIEPKKWNDNEYTNKSLHMIYDLIPLVDEDVAASEKLTDFYKKYENILRISKQKRRELSAKYKRPFIKIKNIESPDLTKPEYCICGEYEIFYQKMNNKNQPIGEKKKITNRQINEWLQNKDYEKVKEFRELTIMERKCISCKNKPKVGIIDIFYKYYEAVCPMGELHIFIDEKCKKCGLTYGQIKQHDEKYFAKYKNIFGDLRKKERKLAEEANIKSSAKKIQKKELKKYKEWVINYTKINELIKTFKISENVFFNIGLYEKNIYESIKSNIIQTNDMKNAAVVKRNNTIYDYYLYIVRNYYLLKNSELMVIAPPILKDFLSKFNNKDIYKKLPDINCEFLDIYKFYRRTHAPQKITNFLLHMIAQTLLEIYTIFKKNKDVDMGQHFVRMLLENILGFEKKLTDFRVIRIRTKIEDDFDTKTDDYDDGDTPQDDISADLEYGDEFDDNDQDDPFSIGDMDIEIDDPDNADEFFEDVRD